jgi:hypothetical protein
MNPLEWLKAIYGVFGTPYPRASLTVVTLLGALIFCGIWIFAAKQVAKDRAALAPAPQSTSSGSVGSASTSGANSPIVPGSGNSFNYSEPEHSSKDKSASKKD